MTGAITVLRDYWDRRARECSTDAERVDSTERSQRARFADLARQLGGARSVLDVGCGVGDLYGYLRGIGWQGEYRGVDLSPAMVDRARAKYHGGSFNVGSPLEWPDSGRADVVAAVGIFNLPFAPPLQESLRKLLALSRVAAYVSLLSSRQVVPPSAKSWSPVATLAVAQEVTPWVTLQHDYLPHDFSITLRREQRR